MRKRGENGEMCMRSGERRRKKARRKEAGEEGREEGKGERVKATYSFMHVIRYTCTLPSSYL